MTGNHAEIGVYILGSMAIAVLAAAGFWRADNTIVACAVIAAGLAYLSQLAVTIYLGTGSPIAFHANWFIGCLSLTVWAAGAALFLVS